MLPSLLLLVITLSEAREQFCQEAMKNRRHIRWEYFLERAAITENRLSFENFYTKITRGACWWRSQWTRNAIHLAVFRPDLQKPTPFEAMLIIYRLKRGVRVTEIPGFANLWEFSVAYEAAIKVSLERWSVGSGIFLFEWLLALQGRPILGAEKLRTHLWKLYRDFRERPRMIYQMHHLTQFRHAWILLDIQKAFNDVSFPIGFDLTYLDSNYLQIQHYRYHFGDEILDGDFGPFVPYTQHEEDFIFYARAIRSYCAPVHQTAIP